MANYIFYRILGYMVTIALHGGNIYFMAQPKPKEILDDPRIKGFLGLRTRFLTGWTFTLQLVFAVAGLLCDLLTLINSSKRDYKLPKYLRGFRDTLFCSIVYPSVLFVFSLFWVIYTYDRDLVYPKFLDNVLTPASNHIMHTAILPLALWEVYFQPRRQPRSHVKYILHGLFYFVLYVSVLFYTYYERGIWIYPILKELYGTIYLPILIIFSLIMALLIYISHWVLVYILWKTPEKNQKSKKKVR